MKALVISYSLTGNNEVLAGSVASKLEAKHIKIEDTRQRTNFSIAMDMLLNRTPKVIPDIDGIEEFDLVIFIGPVWMGHIATPFRYYFKKYRGKLNQYAFISLSGGADGKNTGLDEELKKRLHKEPLAVINLLIADLLSGEKDLSRELTQNYRLNQLEATLLTDEIIISLKELLIEN